MGARENLEGIIDDLSRRFDHYVLRMYRRNARKDDLNLAKCKKRTGKKIRRTIRQQFQYIRRHRKYIDEFLNAECELTPKQTERFAVIDKVYEQQEYMCKHIVQLFLTESLVLASRTSGRLSVVRWSLR